MTSMLRINRENAARAAALARIHLLKMRRQPEFQGLHIHEVFPMLEPGGREDLVFDVKLSGPDGEDRGYIVVSLWEKYPPVAVFTLEGPSLVELLDRAAGGAPFIPVFYTAMYAAAEKDTGEFLCEYGPRPALPFNSSSRKLDQDAPFSKLYPEFKRQFLKYRVVELENMKPYTSRAWESHQAPLKDAGQNTVSPYVDEEDVPANEYLVIGAAHPRSIPSFTQIPPRTGVNDRRFYSGCAACAWMCLIGYHDNAYTADLLRGSDLSDSSDRDGYQDRVMMALSEHLGTVWCFGMGSTLETNMEHGYSFIESYLGHSCVNTAFTTHRGMQALDIVLEYLELYHAPSVISIPRHALIAYEVRYDLGENEDHYLRVYNGDGSGRGNDPFIPISQLKGAWALQAVPTRTQISLPWSSPDVPAFADAGDYLAAAFRAEDGSIILACSEDGETFEVQKQYPGSGRSAPSLINVDHKYLFLAWSDVGSGSMHEPMHLVQLAVHNLADQGLPVPHTPVEDADQTPALAVCRSRLHMLWKSRAVHGAANLVCTDLDDLGRQGQPWPAAPGDAQGAAFWRFLPIHIIGRPSLITDGDVLFLGYRRLAREEDGFTLDGRVNCLAQIDYLGDLLGQEYVDYSMHTACPCCALGGLMYRDREGLVEEFLPWCCESRYPGSYRFRKMYTAGGKIATFWQYMDDSGVTAIHRIAVEEIHWPAGMESQHGVVLGSYVGMKIGPCVFSAWNGHDGKILIRYHSIDHYLYRIPDEGWPLETSAWPDDMF